VKKLSLWFKTMLLGFLSLLLRQHGKRIVLATTLFMQLAQLQNFNRERMSQLNESLELARSEQALEFPCLLCNVVWGENISKNKPYITGNEEEAVSFIVSLIPDWLRYSQAPMIDDIRLVVHNSRVNHVVPA